MTTPGLQRNLVADSLNLIVQGEIDLLGEGDIKNAISFLLKNDWAGHLMSG